MQAYQVITLLSGKLETDETAALSILNNIWLLFWGIFWGIGLATIIRIGMTIGKGDIKASKLVMKVSFFLTVICCFFFSSLSYLFRNEIALLYSSDKHVTNIVSNCLQIVSILFFIGGIGWSGSAVLEGLSRVKIRAYIYVATAWFVYFPISLIIVYYTDLCEKWDINRVFFIWCVALAVETIRSLFIWFLILFYTDWKALSKAAQKRSEAKKLNKNKNEKKRRGKAKGSINSDGNSEEREYRKSLLKEKKKQRDLIFKNVNYGGGGSAGDEMASLAGAHASGKESEDGVWWHWSLKSMGRSSGHGFNTNAVILNTPSLREDDEESGSGINTSNNAVAKDTVNINVKTSNSNSNKAKSSTATDGFDYQRLRHSASD